MGDFDGIGNARFAGRDPFFGPNAEYLIEVAEVQFYQSQNPQHNKTKFFKIRGRVLSVAFDSRHYDPETFVSRAEDGDDETGVLRPGQYGTQLINMAHGDPAMGDIKCFATAFYRTKARQAGLDPDEVVKPETFGEAEITALFGPDQPCAGSVIGLKTTGKTTLKGGAFTQHYWEEGGTFRFSLPERGRIEVAAPVAAS